MTYGPYCIKYVGKVQKKGFSMVYKNRYRKSVNQGNILIFCIQNLLKKGFQKYKGLC